MPWFDEFVVGVVSELGEHRFGAQEIIRFARQFDPQPFHVSEEAGKASLFGGLAASGWHTASLFKSLVERYAQQSRGGADGVAPPDVMIPGATDVKWLKPVLAGDKIRYRMTVTDKALSETNPGWGVVSVRGEGHNQRGELVFQLDERRYAKVRA